MRILYILNSTYLLGGATKSFLQLISALKEKGIEILIICPDKNGLFQYLKSQNIEVKSIKYMASCILDSKSNIECLFNILRLLKRFYINSHATLRLCFVCKRFQPDIIHTNTSVNDIGFKAGKICGIPHVWHIREYGDLDFGWKIPHLDRRLCAPNNYSIAITKAIALHRKVFGRPNNRIIYNGIVNSAKVKEIDEAKEPYFLFAGKCTEGKGFNDLIRAYIKYCQSVRAPLKLIVTGNKEDTDNTQKQWELLKNSHLEKNVEWIGIRKDIDVYMSKAMAVIVPSRCEGFGRVMVESMYNGGLVIGRNTGGSKEQFDKGSEINGKDIGLRYDAEQDLVKHMKVITEIGISEFLPMIKRAQQTVLHLYATENYVNSVILFYKDILKL